MSNDHNNQNRGPDYVALSVREGEDGKGYFNRIGAAFAHKDGKGHNIELDAHPVNGRIVLREPSERQDQDERRHDDDRMGRNNKSSGHSKKRNQDMDYGR